jgi:hypothetical protein
VNARLNTLYRQQAWRSAGGPRVSARDDGIARSHEEVEAVLYYAVPGARVTIRRPHLRAWNQKNTEAERVYEIAIQRGSRSHVRSGGYSLPVNANQLARDARNAIAEAMSSAP